MELQSVNEYASASFNKDIVKVKRAGIASLNEAADALMSRRGADVVRTSSISRVMSRELARAHNSKPASSERLAGLMARFGANSPAAFGDADIDAVLHGMLQRA